MNIISIFLLSALYFIFINLMYKLFNKKIMNKKLLYLTLFFSIFNVFLYKYYFNLNFIISIIILLLHLLYCKIFLKIKLHYNILFTISGILLWILLTNLLIYVSALIPCINKIIPLPLDLIYSALKLLSFILLNFIIYICIKKNILNFFFENISSKYIKLFIIISCITILPQVINLFFEKFEFKITYLTLSFIQLLFIYFFIFQFIYTNLKKHKIDKENNLLNDELTRLTIINEETRVFKHDFNNIISLINGYVLLKKYSDLQTYIGTLIKQCDDINSISSVNSNIFNHPGIYGIMINKALNAKDKKIKFNIQSSIDYNNINFSADNLSRILGILIDNAFEAALKSEEKYVLYEAYYSNVNNTTIIRISNTFNKTSNIELDRIFEKGYSNKKVKSGIGLWEVKSLIDESKNSLIKPEINDNKFIQNIIINNN